MSKRSERIAEVARLIKTLSSLSRRSEARIHQIRRNKASAQSKEVQVVVIRAKRRHRVWLTLCRELLTDALQSSSLVAPQALATHLDNLVLAPQAGIHLSEDQSSLLCQLSLSWEVIRMVISHSERSTCKVTMR